MGAEGAGASWRRRRGGAGRGGGAGGGGGGAAAPGPALGGAGRAGERGARRWRAEEARSGRGERGARRTDGSVCTEGATDAPLPARCPQPGSGESRRSGALRRGRCRSVRSFPDLAPGWCARSVLGSRCGSLCGSSMAPFVPRTGSGGDGNCRQTRTRRRARCQEGGVGAARTARDSGSDPGLRRWITGHRDASPPFALTLPALPLRCSRPTRGTVPRIGGG